MYLYVHVRMHIELQRMIVPHQEFGYNLNTVCLMDKLQRAISRQNPSKNERIGMQWRSGFLGCYARWSARELDMLWEHEAQPQRIIQPERVMLVCGETFLNCMRPEWGLVGPCPWPMKHPPKASKTDKPKGVIFWTHGRSNRHRICTFDDCN